MVAVGAAHAITRFGAQQLSADLMHHHMRVDPSGVKRSALRLFSVLFLFAGCLALIVAVR